MSIDQYSGESIMRLCNSDKPHCFKGGDKCNCCGLERRRGSPI